jgi:hypothetical protein
MSVLKRGGFYPKIFQLIVLPLHKHHANPFAPVQGRFHSYVMSWAVDNPCTPGHSALQRDRPNALAESVPNST